MTTKNQFDWVDFYKEFANKLLQYKDNRKELVKKVLETYKRTKPELPSLLKGDITDIDPFTVFALFNKTSESKNGDNRKKIISAIADLFGVTTPEPTSFDGIPVTSDLAVRFYNSVGAQKDNDINELWSLFESALTYADSNTLDNRSTLSTYFDRCLKKHGNGTSKITMGLYWIDPDFFLNLDSRNVWYIYQFEKEINKLEKEINKLEKEIDKLEKEIDESKKEIYKSKKEIYKSKKEIYKSQKEIYESKEERLPSDLVNTLPVIKKDEKIESSKYWDITDKLRNYLQEGKSDFKDFKELSYEAWRCSEEINQINKEKGSKKQKKVKDKSNDLVYKNILAPPIDNVAEPEQEYSSTYYNRDMFLKEVYMDEKNYEHLVALIKRKKNIILQGAPGVGKTFVAQRLAYSMLGTKNDSHIMMVQFHQSYSYEDFIMGYRPTNSSFELKYGAFYNFCKKAAADRQHEYFFIIDEINRGNLSKIFGELFMLIENDKRGVELPLLYSDEKFAIPGNVYLIGTMNTADRSLAMLDYALRRRFSFYEMSPGFETEGFLEYKTELNNKKFDHLIKCVKELNDEIMSDDSLGEGFYIGHSYFCNLDKNDSNEKKFDNILAGIVAFELIPLLKEYWFDEPEKVNKWTMRLMDAIK